MIKPLFKTINIELSFSCVYHKILDTSSSSKFDPRVLVYEPERERPDAYVLIGATEKVHNVLNPIFTVTLNINYKFEAIQPLRIVVCNGEATTNYSELSKLHVYGIFDLTLADVIYHPSRRIQSELLSVDQVYRGTIDIKAEFSPRSHQKLHFEIACKNLEKKDFFGKSDPFFKIYKHDHGLVWNQAYISDIKKKTLDPHYEKVKLSADDLCDGRLDNPIKFEFMDWNKAPTPSELIGNFETTFNTLAHVKELPSFSIVNQKKKESKKGYVNSGVCHFKSIVHKSCYPYNILDFIVGGCQIGMMVAVDCTTSTGPLHALQYGTLNQFEHAIMSIGRVLTPYDTIRQVPFYGFGGQVDGASPPSHCFPMNIGGPDQLPGGIDQVHKIYKENIAKVMPAPSTNLVHVLEKAIGQVQNGLAGPLKYTILLIVTTAVSITDIDKTKQLIAHASHLPLSIIIMGVGNGPFGAVQEEFSGKPIPGAARNVVQFIPYATTAPYVDIAQASLQEIPKQFISYFKRHLIVPSPPTGGYLSQIQEQQYLHYQQYLIYQQQYQQHLHQQYLQYQQQFPQQYQQQLQQQQAQQKQYQQYQHQLQKLNNK
ncbi:hypothetical protein DFA_03255 [Cavenderia fasciculata]|uniref:C2 domain-containing protein n=1 Tax=Cavenderia fasciculata TaxID=261658 RepID=F4PH25_CACFS|nr:uncharacterized protein DFA_03255 [Cavenderia fasciculata]EGG25009.1 hypothetical protein DFA_03255 [Cavenderia fasciculata]|eukprot:XP_004362860.1 hypothetical protein DFA_03255 [Cavenderia fasciculata]